MNVDLEKTLVIDTGTKPSAKIAAFDARTSVFRNKREEDLIYGANESIEKLVKDGYKVVIFHNTPSKIEVQVLSDKLKNLLGVPFQLVYSFGFGCCQKPNNGMWELMEQNNPVIIDKTKSFYVGDNAGRSSDPNDFDYKFALNCGVKYYTPDEFYDDCKIKLPTHTHPLTNVKQVNRDYCKLIPKTEKTMVILVGPPFCGKSTFCEKKEFSDFTVLDQKDAKQKKKFMENLEQILGEGKCVIIDKKNEHKVDRLEYIEMAKTHNYRPVIVWFDISKELCKHLHKYKELATNEETSPIVISKYFSENKGLDPPSSEECEVFRETYLIDEKYIDKNIYKFLS